MRLCLILSIVFLQIFTGCNSGNEDKILIGFVGNLTGRVSDLAISGRNGFELAIEKINSEGGIKGKKLVAIIKDDENNPKRAYEVDSELVNSGVVVTVGHYLSTPAESVVSIFNKSKTVILSPTISSVLFSGIDDYLFKIMGDSKLTGEAIAAEVIKTCKTVTGLYESSNHVYAQMVLNSFILRYKELGGKVLDTTSFKSGESNLHEVALKLLSKKPDGVVSIASGFDNAILCQNLVAVNPKIQVFSGQYAMTEDFIKNAGHSANNIKFAGIVDLNSNDKDFIEFRDNYVERYNQNPTFSSLLSYEAVMILAEAMRKIDSNDNDEIRRKLKETLLNVKKFNGVCSKIIFDKYGDAEREFQIFTVQNGKYLKFE